MFILGVDTTTDYLSVAVCEDAAMCAETTFRAGRTHAERLVDAIDQTLNRAGISLSELDLLAVAHGPGSFTGLRIGVSTMKGLALGAAKPLVGVSTLDAMTRCIAMPSGIVCPLLDARMDEVYGAAYRFADGQREKIHDEIVGPVEGLLKDLPDPVTVFGEGAAAYRKRITVARPDAQLLTEMFNPPRGAAVAQEALSLHQQGANADAGLVRPVYLRKSQPEEARARHSREAAPA